MWLQSPSTLSPSISTLGFRLCGPAEARGSPWKAGYNNNNNNNNNEALGRPVSESESEQ